MNKGLHRSMEPALRVYRPFTVNTVPFRQAGPVQNNCNGVSFYNAGNTVAYVDAMPILPYQGWTPFEPNPDEIDITNYNISFDETGVESPSNYLIVIRKSYEQSR